MTNDRLSALAIISIENKIARSLDYDALINQFAENKARKKHVCVNIEVTELTNLYGTL
jgi:hypothetical protein